MKSIQHIEVLGFIEGGTVSNKQECYRNRKKKWMQTLIFGKFKNFVSSGSEKPSQKRGCLSWILKPDGKVVQFKACIITLHEEGGEKQR